MADLLKNDRIKIEILKELSEEGRKSPSRLSSDLEYKHETIDNALEFLKKIGAVTGEESEHGDRTYRFYDITDLGRKLHEEARNR